MHVPLVATRRIGKVIFVLAGRRRSSRVVDSGGRNERAATAHKQHAHTRKLRRDFTSDPLKGLIRPDRREPRHGKSAASDARPLKSSATIDGEFCLGYQDRKTGARPRRDRPMQRWPLHSARTNAVRSSGFRRCGVISGGNLRYGKLYVSRNQSVNLTLFSGPRDLPRSCKF